MCYTSTQWVLFYVVNVFKQVNKNYFVIFLKEGPNLTAKMSSLLNTCFCYAYILIFTYMFYIMENTTMTIKKA